MFDQIITECKIFNPTLERAFKVAPKEFVSAYQWFIDHENSEIDKLPHRLEKRIYCWWYSYFQRFWNLQSV